MYSQKLHKGDCFIALTYEKFRIHIIYGSRLILLGGLKCWN